MSKELYRRGAVICISAFFGILGLSYLEKRYGIKFPWTSDGKDSLGEDGLPKSIAAGIEAESNAPKSSLNWRDIVEPNSPFPDSVNRWAEQFWAGTDNAMDSWIRENGRELPIDRRILLGRLIFDVRAIATLESHGDPNAVSSEGAIGIMQLKPKYYAKDGADLFNPHVNIFRGCRVYLDRWISAYEELGKPNDLLSVSYVAAVRYRVPTRSANPSYWGYWDRCYFHKFVAALRGQTIPSCS